MATYDKTLVVRACVLSISLCAWATGCGGSASASLSTSGGGTTAKSETGKEIKTQGGQAVNLAAHNKWKEGVAAFKAADKQGWNDQRCEDVAGRFEAAASAQKKFAEALYMAGASHLKCGHKQKALTFFQQAIRQNPKFCKAR